MANVSFVADSFSELLDKINDYVNSKSKDPSYANSRIKQNRGAFNGKRNKIKTNDGTTECLNEIDVPYSAADISKCYSVATSEEDTGGVKTTTIRVIAPLAIKESVKLSFKDSKNENTIVTLSYKNDLARALHGASYSTFVVDENITITFDGGSGNKYDKKNVKLDMDQGIIKIQLKTLPVKEINDETVFTLR